MNNTDVVIEEDGAVIEFPVTAQAADECLTIAELAALEAVSENTMRSRIKTLGMPPNEMRKNATGPDSPLYSRQTLQLNWRVYTDLKQLSTEGRENYAIGHIERTGTDEQVAELRENIDSMRGDLRLLENHLEYAVGMRHHAENVLSNKIRDVEMYQKQFSELICRFYNAGRLTITVGSKEERNLLLRDIQKRARMLVRGY